MITYIDSKNANQYYILFDKATKLLKDNQNSLPDITETLNTYDMSWDTFSISTLNEYFAYLKRLTELAPTEDEKKFYLRLPLDEDIFEINANTREITVPVNFATNGVGVQGDEMSEVVYFSIDRFFDSTDLANDEIKIAIQWEARDPSGNITQGFSRNFGKDIETIPGKIIFGWPISSEFTKASGTIRFAVRFYQTNENSEFTYSLTTLPATVRIQASLDYDVINKTVPEIDHGNTLIGRVVSSGIYDKSLPTPAEPNIVKDLFVYSPANSENRKVIDLPSTGGVTLAIGIQPSDIGIAGADWQFVPYSNGEYNSSSATSISQNPNQVEGTLPSFSEIYSPVKETLNNDKNYFIKVSDEQYSKFIDFDSLDNLEYQEPEEEGDEGGYLVSGVITPLYEKLFTATVDKTGIYTVNAYSRALVNTKTKKMDITDGIKIPGPLKPEFDLNGFNNPAIEVNKEDQSIHIATDEDNFNLSVMALTGESQREEAEKEEDPDPQVEFFYKWQKMNTAGDWTDIEGEDNTDLTVSGLNLIAPLDEKYHAVVTAKRNGQTTTATSGIYRITPTPKAPVVSVKFKRLTPQGTLVTTWEERSYDPQNPSNNKVTMNANDTLDIRVNSNIQSDKLSYAWMFYKTERAIDLTDEAVSNSILETLETKLEEIFGNPWENDMDTIVQDLTAFSELQTLENETQVYTSSFTPSETGFYYCVVINELNGHINATATPLFQVVNMQ